MVNQPILLPIQSVSKEKVWNFFAALAKTERFQSVSQPRAIFIIIISAGPRGETDYAMQPYDTRGPVWHFL